MKKNLIFAVACLMLAAAAVTGYAAYSTANESGLISANVEAMAQGEINPNCPNGCKAGETGCYCNFYYRDAREAN